MPEGTQRYSRAKVVLPLRVWLDVKPGATLTVQWAHTIDISQIGCRLGGLHTELSPGQTIALQRGQDKALFRVIWSKHLATNENQAGFQALDCGKNIWSVGFRSFHVAANSTKSSCTGEDSSTTAFAPPVPVPQMSAPTRGSTHNYFVFGAVHPGMRRSLTVGLLLLNLALEVCVGNGVFYHWGLGIGLLLLSVALGLSRYRGHESSTSWTSADSAAS